MRVPRKQRSWNIGGLVNAQGTHMGLWVKVVGSYSCIAGLMRTLLQDGLEPS